MVQQAAAQKRMMRHAAWAEEGYCSHEQYKQYMERSCRNACGFGPLDADDPDTEAHEAEAIYEDEEMDNDEGAAGGGDTSAEGTETASGARAAPKSAAEESEHCPGWARQGLCEGARRIMST